MEVNSRKFEPMVAFICNKPAMHRVPSGWVADDDSSKSCVKEPEEILKYCKKVSFINLYLYLFLLSDIYNFINSN